ncbi:MAG: glutathione peroxidase [Gemmatales bacterium]
MRRLLVAAFLASFVGLTLQAGDKPVSDVLNQTVKNIDGKDVNLADYRGKVVLVVNVASQCGYTKQYTGLQKIYEKYKDDGFVILGFPCNQFGGQEPGTEADIKQFCSSKYSVTFPLFAKIDVNGDNTSPVYAALKGQKAGDIKWNFEKFLINKKGEVVARYGSKTTPEGSELTAAIEAELKK